LESTDDLAAFGFDPPQATARIRYIDGSEAVMHLGFTTPDGDHYYIMREGDPAVYLINRNAGDRYLFTLDDLIYKRMPLIDAHRLEYAYIINDGHEIELMQSGVDSAVRMTKPFPGRDIYMSQFMHTVLGDIQDIHFDTLVSLAPDDEAEYGLDAPWLEVLMRDDVGFFHLLVGNDAGGGKYYSRRGDDQTMFTIDGELIRGFRDADVFLFINRFVALKNIDQVERIVITDGDVRIEVLPYAGQSAHSEDERELTPLVDDIEVDIEDFRTWFHALIGLSYDSAFDEFDPDEEVPAFVVEYSMNGGQGGEIMRYEYYDYNDHFYAIESEGQWFAVNKQSVTTVQRLLVQLSKGEL
jgi:hypothetical protein